MASTAGQFGIKAQFTIDESAMIEKAALVKGCSVEEFVRETLRQAAHEAIEEHQVIVLSERDSKAFLKSLETPEEPGPQLHKAKKMYEKLVRK